MEEPRTGGCRWEKPGQGAQVGEPGKGGRGSAKPGLEPGQGVGKLGGGGLGTLEWGRSSLPRSVSGERRETERLMVADMTTREGSSCTATMLILND